MVQKVQAYQVDRCNPYLPLVQVIQVAHSYLYHPLVLGVPVYQILAILAFLANLVVLEDLSHLACLVVLVDHFDLASLDQVDLLGQAVLFHLVVQLALDVLDVPFLLVVPVVLVCHSIQVYQNQAILLDQQAQGALEALCVQVVLATPSLCLLWVPAVLVNLEDLCDLAHLWAPFDLVNLEHLVYLCLEVQVVLGVLEALAVQVVLLHP